jgi:hypothetical protein
MALDVEGVLDRGVNGEEPLRRSGRFETLHLPFPSTYRQVRILGPIVLAQALLMASRQAQFCLGRSVGSRPVGHQYVRRKALLLEQSAHEFRSRLGVASPLHQQVENLALIVDRPPEPEPPAADQNRHFIEMPCMDAPARARWFRMVWSRDRVRSCIRPSGAACHDRWPVWRCAEQAQNQRGELLSSMASYCISWPGSDRSFALTVPRSPHTPDVPLAAQPDRGSEGSSHRTSIIFPLCQHGPD